MGGHMMDWGTGAGMAWGLPMLLFWGLVAVAVVLLVRWLASGGGSARRSRDDAALAILRERYARGEIDKEEFEARKRDLQ